VEGHATEVHKEEVPLSVLRKIRGTGRDVLLLNEKQYL
jgi:hypothetical protein